MTVALAVRTSPAVPRGVPPPLIRLRPAPDLEPPYDEDPGLPPPPLDDLTAPALPPDALPREAPAPADRPSGEARLAAHRYLTLCLEVLGGFRPLAHLRPLSSAAALEQITIQLARSRLAGPPHDRIALRQVRLCEPGDGVVEVAAVLGRTGQVWAMALRLERHHGIWVCIHLEVL
jgi:hypothetical protein